jgi:hypothetical protein
MKHILTTIAAVVLVGCVSTGSMFPLILSMSSSSGKFANVLPERGTAAEITNET